jgi:hypothetical protein
MHPSSPVVRDIDPRFNAAEVVYAKDQPEYIPLPTLKFSDGLVVSRWTLNWKERLRLLFGGSVYLGLLTFNGPLQPILIATTPQEVIGVIAEEAAHESLA